MFYSFQKQDADDIKMFNLLSILPHQEPVYSVIPPYESVRCGGRSIMATAMVQVQKIGIVLPLSEEIRHDRYFAREFLDYLNFAR